MRNRIIYFMQQSWLLIVGSIFFGLLLAVTNAALRPRIEQNRIDKLNRLAGRLLPQAEHFVPLDNEIEITSTQGKPQGLTVYEATSDSRRIGWSFTATGSGFADKIELVVAVGPDFQNMAGYNVLASNETPGFGDKIKLDWYRSQFAGAPAGGLELQTTGDSEKIDEEIVAITGATISSEAVVETINNALSQLKQKMAQQGLIPKPSSPEMKGAAEDVKNQEQE